MKVFRKIEFNGNWFNHTVTYRFQYSAFTSKRYIQEEGETIVYTIPDGVKKLKIGNTYYNLDKLSEKPHQIKAKAILELKKRRKQKFYLKKEGKPKWDNSYKTPPKTIYRKGKKPINKNVK